MFVEVIQTMDLSREEKIMFHRMAKVYSETLPDSLYLNHYQLAETYGYTAQDWNRFLKMREIDHLIQAEIAQIAEIGARQALQRLQTGNATSPDIQAARELISNSKLIKQKVNQRQHFVITRIPSMAGGTDGE